MKKNKFSILLLSLLIMMFLVSGCSQNRAPVIENLSSPDGMPISPGEKITIQSEVNDPEGDYLDYLWSCDDGEIIEDYYREDKIEYVAPNPASEDSYKVYLTVKDSEGNSTSQSISISVKDKAPEIKSIDFASDNKVQTNELKKGVGIFANATDPEGSSLSYKWSVPDGGTIEETLSDDTINYYLPSDATVGEKYEIKLTVTDSMDNKDSESVYVKVVSQPPVINSVTPSEEPVEFATDETQDFSVDASDPDGNSLTYSWGIYDKENNELAKGKFDSSGPQVNFDPGELTPGDYTIKVQIKDGTGNIVGKVWDVDLLSPGPEVTSYDIPAEVKTNENVEMSVIVDSNSDYLEYTWSAEKGSFSSNTSSATVEYDAPGSEGTDTISVEIIDEYGGKETLTEEISIINAKPVINSFTASESTVKVGTEVELKVNASDTDSLTYKWTASDSSDNDVSELLTVDSNDRAQAAFSSNNHNQYTIKVHVTDGVNPSVTETQKITVNSKDPVIDDVNYNDTIKWDETTTFTLDVHDPDTNNAELNYAWSTNKGTITPSGDPATSATLDPDDNDWGTYEVSVNISDGNGGVANKSYEVTVESKNPTITEGPLLSKTSLYNDENLNLEVTADDSDNPNDNLSYKWKIDGKPLGIDANIVDITPIDYDFMPGEHSVNVKITDGNGGVVTSDDKTFTINNRKPDISDVTASPSSVKTSEESRLSVSASDPDQEDLNYNWNIVQGSGSFDGNGSSVTYIPDPEKGIHIISVTVTDNSGGSTTSQELDIEVTNSAPVINSFTTSSNRTLGLNETLDFTVKAEDIDDDASTLNYKWETNYGTINSSGNSATYTSPQYVTSDTITVTVSDSSGDSVSASKSVEVKNIWQKTYSYSSFSSAESYGSHYILVNNNGKIVEVNANGEEQSVIDGGFNMKEIKPYNGGYIIVGKDSSDGYYKKIKTDNNFNDYKPNASVFNAALDLGSDQILLAGIDDEENYAYASILNAEHKTDPIYTGENEMSEINDVLELNDGLLLVGSSDNGQESFVKKIDRDGNEYWGNEIDIFDYYIYSETVQAVEKTTDGYLMVVNNTHSGGSRLVTLGEQGSIKDQENIGVEKINDMEKLDDGYLLAGKKNGNAYVEKLDTNADSLWQEELNSGTFNDIVAGNDYYLLSGESNGSGYVVRIYKDGSVGEMK